MALDPTNALVLLATVKTELGISGSSEDSYLESLIEAASAEIHSYCSRTFPKATVTNERHKADNEPHLVLKRAPLASITSITENGSTVDSTTYEIIDEDAGLVQFFTGYRPFRGYARRGVEQLANPGFERWSVLVTYVGGYVTPVQSAEVGGDYEGDAVTLPADIQQAVIETVTALYKGQGVAGGYQGPPISERMFEASVSYENPSNKFGVSDKNPARTSIPTTARLKLDKYRFIEVL